MTHASRDVDESDILAVQCLADYLCGMNEVREYYVVSVYTFFAFITVSIQEHRLKELTDDFIHGRVGPPLANHTQQHSKLGTCWKRERFRIKISHGEEGGRLRFF